MRHADRERRAIRLDDHLQTLLLYSSEPIGQKPERADRPTGYFATTWLFYVEALADGTTRLISRYRLGYTPSFGNDLAYRGLVEPISAVVQRKMLLERQEANRGGSIEPSSPVTEVHNESANGHILSGRGKYCVSHI